VAAGFTPLQVKGLLAGVVTDSQRGVSAVYDQVVPWVRATTPDSAVIAGENEALVWLYTGRRTVPSNLWHLVGREPVSFGPDSLHAYFGRVGATLVLVTDTRSAAVDVLDDAAVVFPGYLRAVKSWPVAVVALAVDRNAKRLAPPPSPADTTAGASRRPDARAPIGR
jgi:hypothetical protein